jgi:hypothetical protein
MALESTQPLTEMSTRNLPGCKGRPARKADYFTAICEPIDYKILEPRRLTTLCASKAYYRDSFTYNIGHHRTSKYKPSEKSYCTLVSLNFSDPRNRTIFGMTPYSPVKFTYVSEEHTASICRLKRPTLLISCLPYSKSYDPPKRRHTPTVLHCVPMEKESYAFNFDIIVPVQSRMQRRV